jgi:HipA-like protein
MKALDVFLGSTRVGLLERLDEWQYRFSFDATWLADPEHPVLGQIFEDRKPRDLESTGTLPTWFDHLLPPQGGPLRRAISRQSGIEGDDDFALLELLGADLPGAVVLSPGTPSLAPRPVAPAAPKPPIEGELRFSLAGMQWKLSVREQDRKLTLPLRGETGGVIAKFPSEPFATHGLALTLDNTRRFEGVSVASFRPMAEVTRHSFDEVSTWVREMVERVLAAWHERAAELPYLADERALIDAHLARVPLARP